MPNRRRLLSLRRIFAIVSLVFLIVSIGQGQGVKHVNAQSEVPKADGDHVKERSEWFSRGRVVPGKPSAELRRRAYEAKLRTRAERAALAATANLQGTSSSSTWTPLGPVPLASDATGDGAQDYHQVAGRATAVVIDPADPSGNIIYIGGAQSGVWRSTNAANATAANVTWTATTDNQATLSIGAMAIQPGNSNPSATVILAATGEANNSGDSYFGLGILRSANAGSTWSLISTANNGALSFSGLGGTRMAFSTASGQTNTVVAAMATSSEGLIDGAVTANTTRGLYTSRDAGQSWTYDALTDPGGATDATSATSVVFNASAGLFFAAVRYHGFYSSPDGTHWTRLAAQPAGAALSTAACPPQSASNGYACPIYRAELTVVPGRNEMYAWVVTVSSGEVLDGGIWQSLNGGSSWTAISDTGITNCGDVEGCGVEQGTYNLELLAVPNGSVTDLYAGAINLYKCSINPQNPSCTSAPFLNLTHVYGCDPIAAPAHVHPDQHALAYAIPSAGTDSGNALMYFANDGGVYRALDAFGSLRTGSCSGTNGFDDLNQNLGSMTQFVSFAQHPTDANTLLGGSQDNGSPATSTATQNTSWGNVLGGDGGYSAIDPYAVTDFYASNPDVPPGGLGVQMCPNGASCNDSGFHFVATSGSLGGDDGAFYFPYILDYQSPDLLIGTCRVWRGARSGGAFTALSPNFDTLDSSICSGNETNQVRALATGGPADNNGSKVIYATTSGFGPIDGPLNSPTGGHVWVTTNSTAGSSAFADVTANGPQGSINPDQFPVSSVAIDSSDATGATAYVTVMGFTGGVGHVWKTTNAGVSWIDFTGNLPDSPVNAVIVDSGASALYVGTDVGVFASATSAASWTELGPNSSSGLPGFLPNVAVTALGLFNSGGQKLLRASTYGRGMWQYNLVATPDYQLAVSGSPQTIFFGTTASFTGTATELDGYASTVNLSCVAGTTPPPSTCSVSPATITPANGSPFSIKAGGASGDYTFNLQGVGSDAKHITHQIPVTLHVVSFAVSTPSPASVTVPRGTTSSPVSFQVTAAGSFNQSVAVSCTLGITNAVCALTPGTTVNPTSTVPVNMTASVSVPATTAPGSYTVTIQASTPGTAAITTSFSLVVTANPDFVLSEPVAFPEINAGSSGTTGQISIAAQDGFTGTVALNCPSTYGSGSCSISPATVSSYPASATLTINGTSFSAGSYSLSISGSSGSVIHTIAVPFYVGDYELTGTKTVSLAPGGQGAATLQVTASAYYSGKINASCDASALSGATCTISPSSPITVSKGGSVSLTATINVPNNASAGTYNVPISTHDTTGAPNHAFNLTLTVAQDFLVTSATATQAVNAGQTSGPYNLTIQPVGASFNSAVTLTCSGLPALAQCVFSPSTPVTPGNAAADVVMSITTSGASAREKQLPARRRSLSTIWLGVTGMIVGLLLASSPRKRRMIVVGANVFIVLALLVALLSCSGVSSGGGGGGGGCSAVPSVPLGLTATSTTASSTTLNWNASSAIAGCSVSAYTVYENETPIGSPTTNSYVAMKLSGGTQYSFTVTAQDSAGSSAPSAPILVTTASGGTPPGTYTITITGTSPGVPADAGQSTQVTLVVN